MRKNSNLLTGINHGRRVRHGFVPWLGSEANLFFYLLQKNCLSNDAAPLEALHEGAETFLGFV